MNSIREPAVAGTFYPSDRARLSAMIDSYLEGEPVGEAPKAIIAPHAGYIYSGPIAGSAYRQLAAGRESIRRVVLLGPSHRVAFRGMAIPGTEYFRTPLGDIPLDLEFINTLKGLPGVSTLDQAHQHEHSLEVHLPFLQRALNQFTLVPVVVGDADAESVARLLKTVWGGPETAIVVSTDLSHFEPYERANEIDRRTQRKIEQLDSTLRGDEACGCRAVNGLLLTLKQLGLAIETLDVQNSADTAGDRARVVGYGAWQVPAQKSARQGAPEPVWRLAERQTLLQLAREAIRSPLEGEDEFPIRLELFAERLRQSRASFVTIKLDGRLRGCIGSLEPHRPLLLDVAHNAQAAAFKDPRFTPLTHAEYQQMELHISVLSVPVEVPVVSRQALIDRLRPGTDGLIINEGGRRATYLPSVWAELPEPEQFVAELRRKAGLSPDSWTAATRVYLYTTEEFS